jgi:hypothetical protein
MLIADIRDSEFIMTTGEVKENESNIIFEVDKDVMKF